MQITRRKALQWGTITATSVLAYGAYRVVLDCTNIMVDPLYRYVKPRMRWTTSEFTEFLGHLNKKQQSLVLGSLGKNNASYDVIEVKKDLMWAASNIIEYPFTDTVAYDYHEQILKWLARKHDIAEGDRFACPSFVLERKIMDSIFVRIWDKLTPEQRRKALEGIDPRSKLKDKAGLALASGAAALAALSATVFFEGFAFYTTMTSLIFAAATAFGVTLPFAAYVGTTTTIAALSGPVGWALLGLAALGSIAFLGRANEAKTAAFVTQIHLIKVQVVHDSHRLDAVLSDLGLH